MSDNQLATAVASAMFIFGFFIGAALGQHVQENQGHVDAIKHHAAHYDPQTGACVWNDESEGAK